MQLLFHPTNSKTLSFYEVPGLFFFMWNLNLVNKNTTDRRSVTYCVPHTHTHPTAEQMGGLSYQNKQTGGPEGVLVSQQVNRLFVAGNWFNSKS